MDEQTLLNTPVENTQDALTRLVCFLEVAQKRGTFQFAESAKIWECIRWFQPNKTKEPEQDDHRSTV